LTSHRLTVSTELVIRKLGIYLDGPTRGMLAVYRAGSDGKPDSLIASTQKTDLPLGRTELAAFPKAGGSLRLPPGNYYLAIAYEGGIMIGETYAPPVRNQYRVDLPAGSVLPDPIAPSSLQTLNYETPTLYAVLAPPTN
jgi:hypothetical protein